MIRQTYQFEVFDDANEGEKTRLELEVHKNGLSIRFPDHPAKEEERPEIFIDFFGDQVSTIFLRDEKSLNPSIRPVTNLSSQKSNSQKD